MTQLSNFQTESFVFLSLCCILMAVCQLLDITASQCGDHTGRSWQATCLIEHISLILNRLRERKVTPSQDGGVADASAIKRLKMASPQPRLLSLSKHSLQRSGVGGVRGDGCSQDNRTK